MTAPYVEAVSLAFSFLALVTAGAFFWRENKVAGLAFLVAFVVSFSAVLGQRVVLSSAVIGVTVEKSGVERASAWSK
jgi:hypothetical protein